MVDLDPYLIRDSLGEPESIPQMASRSVQPFMYVRVLYEGRQPSTDRRDSVPGVDEVGATVDGLDPGDASSRRG